MITYIATAYNEVRHNRPFIESILNQTDSEWEAVIYHNGPNPEMREYIEGYKDDRLVYMESDVNSGNWGTKNRQHGIDLCDSDYIIQTSVQDYWLPQANEYINKCINSNNRPEIVYWNSINHVVGPCLVLDGQLAWSKCDWGQFALKTWIAKKVGIQRGDVYCGDWAFMEDVLKSGYIKNTVKINGVLTCHN